MSPTKANDAATVRALSDIPRDVMVFKLCSLDGLGTMTCVEKGLALNKVANFDSFLC